MRRFFLLVLILAAANAFADAAEEVRQAETAFAKAFADRDQAKFFSFVADDATFLNGRITMTGKPEVIKRWSAFFTSKSAPFSWRPERVAVNAAGNLGLSTGPVFDPEGNQVGFFSSVWQKNAAGEWRVMFDGPGGPPPVSEGFIKAADGARLHYRKIGEGQTVVILPFASLMFDSFKPLANGATLIAYDMRSRGRSDRADDKLSIMQDVEDLESVRKAFNVDRFVPIGFSYLGKMVALYALAHPERVERMVQIGPLPIDLSQFKAHTDEDTGVSAEAVARWRAMQKDPNVAQKEFCDAQDAVMRYVLVGDPAKASKVPSLCMYENEHPGHLNTVFAKMMDPKNAPGLTHEQVKKITAPVLVIHGTYDRNTPYEGGKDWAATMPNARLLTIEKAAHASFIDAPEVVFNAVRTFIAGEWPKEAVK